MPPAKEPRYPLDRRLGEPQDWSERFEEDKNSLGVGQLLNSVLYIRVRKRRELILDFEEGIMLHGMATVSFILKFLLT
jgi:hypothetical protein